MIKEIVVTKEERVCDCCETLLPNERNTFLNDGSYQNDYVNIGDVDLCFICAGKIFDINVVHKVQEEKLSVWIEEARKALKIDGVFGFSKNTPLKTTGINEMVPVESDTMKVPIKTESPLTNLGDI